MNTSSTWRTSVVSGGSTWCGGGHPRRGGLGGVCLNTYHCSDERNRGKGSSTDSSNVASQKPI